MEYKSSLYICLSKNWTWYVNVWLIVYTVYKNIRQVNILYQLVYALLPMKLFCAKLIYVSLLPSVYYSKWSETQEYIFQIHSIHPNCVLFY